MECASVAPAVSHPDSCEARGLGTSEAVAGEQASLVMAVKDLYGNALVKGGEAVTAEIRSKSRSPVEAHVTDLGSGEYSVSYTATTGGSHELHVFLRREPAAGSPFPVTVHASRTVAATCEVDTRQLVGVRVAVPAPFRITAFDRHKNRALRGGDRFRAVLCPPDGADEEELHLDDQGDGTYLGSLVCRHTGAHRLQTYLEHTPLPASPHAIHVESGPPRALCSVARANFLCRSEDSGVSCSGHYSSSSGTPSRPAGRVLQAGVEEEVELSGMDANGNPACADPKDWHVQLHRLPNNASVPALNPPVRAAVDGLSCTVSLRLETAGEYLCAIHLRGEPINGSPYELKVRPGPVDASRSGLHGGEMPVGQAGQEGRLVLVCRDACGNQLPHGGQRLAVQLRCPANGLAQRAAIADQNDGSYLVRFRPDVACEHEVHAWILQRSVGHGSIAGDEYSAPAGERGGGPEEAMAMPVGGSPYLLQVRPGALSCAMSGDLSAEISRLEIVAGSRGSVSLQLRDALGNARPPSGEVFSASLERPRDGRAAALLAGDVAASKREAEVKATASSVAVELVEACAVEASGGAALGGRPMRGRGAAAAALAHPDVAKVEASHSEALAAAVRAAAAAPSTTLGEHHHPLPTPEVGVANGKVNVAFVAARAERLLLHVAVSGCGEGEDVPMRGSPFAVDVQPAATVARRCEAFGEALHRAYLRQSTSFILLARDAHGNRRTLGGDHFIVSFRGPCNPVARVYDRGDGTYRVSYVAGVTGTATMAITLDRQHIVGSPFRLVVEGTRASWTPSQQVSARTASPIPMRVSDR